MLECGHVRSELFGFTLAEVLITLGIIGVVAAITIPILQKNIEDAQFKTEYKKAYSDANNAWARMVADYEVTSRTSSYDSTAANNNFTAFKSHFKILKDCGFSGNSNEECWDFSGDTIKPGGTVIAPTVSNDMRYAAFIDSSGRQWLKNHSNNTFGEIIFVDTNGFKKPNKFGKDRFPLYPVLQTCNYVLYNQFSAECRGAGIPVKIFAYRLDVAAGDMCNIDNCYYRSWLLN